MRPDELGLTLVRPLYNRSNAPNLFTRKTEAALA